jgi:hypothetical protein
MASTKERDPGLVPPICESIARRREIVVEDVATLAETCAGVELTLDEARAVFALARAEIPSCPEWREFFAETMSSWFVGVHARYEVRDAAARSLIGWLGGEEARLDAARFRFLMRVLERAPRCPDELLAFARVCLMRAMGVETPTPRAEPRIA